MLLIFCLYLHKAVPAGEGEGLGGIAIFAPMG